MSHGNPDGLPEAALDAIVSAWALLILIVGIAVLLMSYRLQAQRKARQGTRKRRKLRIFR